MNQKWCVPCLRGVIGDWVYYSALMTPEQLSTRVDVSKKIREAAALDDHLQRTLKTRYTKIARYLLKREDRFFNSIVIGVFGGLPDWVQFDLDSMAKRTGVPEVAGVQDSLGLLIFDGQEKMFAIDGQHRIKGIETAFSKDPQSIKDDEYAVIFVAHQDDKNGKVRTRRLFCDINKNAVSVSEGDKVIIDEDDLCAIVTRRVYSEYTHFKGGQRIAVTDKKEQLVEINEETNVKEEKFTSLLALYTVSKTLKPLHKMALDSLDNDDRNIIGLQQIVSGFFDFTIKSIPSFHSYFEQNELQPEVAREKNRDLFFRPVGLEILARLYERCSNDGTLNAFADSLSTWKFENPGGIWDGLVWKNGRVDASAKAKNAAVQLFLYFMGIVDDETRLLLLIRDVRNNPEYQLPNRSAVPR